MAAEGFGVSADACEAIFANLSQGSLGKLSELDLRDNSIGDSGLRGMLNAAIQRQSMRSLRILMLESNGITDYGMVSPPANSDP